jgi:hypothetical protein
MEAKRRTFMDAAGSGRLPVVESMLSEVDAGCKLEGLIVASKNKALGVVQLLIKYVANLVRGLLLATCFLLWR